MGDETQQEIAAGEQFADYRAQTAKEIEQLNEAHLQALAVVTAERDQLRIERDQALADYRDQRQRTELIGRQLERRDYTVATLLAELRGRST